MNHYVYQITNNINGKIYIGKRSCTCSIEKDTYMGSGVHLKRAIKKYGIENFNKTVIDICDTIESAYELEALIVDTDFIKRTDTYNLCGGGIGTGVAECHPNFGKHLSEETKTKISIGNVGKAHSIETKVKISTNNGMKGKTSELHPKFGKTASEETRTKISINHVGFKGKTHSLETKSKMSANNARANLGKTRSPEAIAKYKATRLFNKLNKQNLT